MATPVVETIRAAIKTKLEELETEGLVTNVLVETRKGLPERLRDKDLVLVQMDELAIDAQPIGAKDRNQIFGIGCVVIPTDTASTAIDNAINALCTAVEEKLMEDTDFGGYATTGIWESRVLPREPFGASEAVSGAWVRLSVFYRTAEFNPYAIG